MALTLLKRKPCENGLKDRIPSERGTAQFCDPSDTRPCITICYDSESCIYGCGGVRKALEEEIKARNLGILVKPMKAGCEGDCPYGVLVGFPQKGFFYRGVTPERAKEVVAETLLKGHILFDLLLIDPFKSTSGLILKDRASRFIATIDESFCMVQVARYFVKFNEGVSCGKCTPCRVGSVELGEILDRIIQGKGQLEDLNRLELIGTAMQHTPYCDFARVCSCPVLLALEYFRPEFEKHVDEHICPAGVCEALVDKPQEKMQKQAEG
jgi:(2Fe-2S) ferredoxin